MVTFKLDFVFTVGQPPFGQVTQSMPDPFGVEQVVPVMANLFAPD